MKEKKTIIMISNYADKQHVAREELITDFIEKGYKVILGGSEFNNNTKIEYQKKDISSIYLPIDRYNINPFKEFNTLMKLKRIMSKIRPDVVLVYGIKIIPSCVIASKLAGIKKIYSYVNGAGNLFVQEGLEVKLLKLIAFPMILISFACSNKVFFQNDDDIKEFKQKRLIEEKKIRKVNGSGVNMNKYYPVEVNSQITFSFIGRLVKEKGLCEFISAAKIVKEKYPKTKFLVAGQLDENDTCIKNIIRGADEDHIIEFIGEIENSNLLLDRTSVFVLPSYREGLPRVNLEAMSKKKAIITTNTVGCRDTVIDGYNGFLVEVKNVNQIVEKMIEFILDKSLIRKMGENGYDLCKEKFEVHKVNSSLIKTICEEDIS